MPTPLGTDDTVLAGISESMAAPPASRLRRGQVIDRYEVVDLLGSGGMGEVYRARDVRLGREVALKLVRAVEAEGSACSSLCSLLAREARTLAQLSHPGPPPRGAHSGYACGCTSARAASFDIDSAIVGTPGYMSPEQAEGRPVDSRTDQFGFAATAWDVLHRSPPFRGASVEELVAAVAAHRVEPPPENTEVPAPITEALHRAMRVAPSTRFPNLNALLEQLVAEG